MRGRFHVVDDLSGLTDLRIKPRQFGPQCVDGGVFWFCDRTHSLMLVILIPWCHPVTVIFAPMTFRKAVAKSS